LDFLGEYEGLFGRDGLQIGLSRSRLGAVLTAILAEFLTFFVDWGFFSQDVVFRNSLSGNDLRVFLIGTVFAV